MPWAPSRAPGHVGGTSDRFLLCLVTLTAGLLAGPQSRRGLCSWDKERARFRAATFTCGDAPCGPDLFPRAALHGTRNWTIGRVGGEPRPLPVLCV